MKTMGTEKMKAWYSLSSAKLEPGEAEEQQRAGGSELEPVSVSEDIFRRPDSHLAKGSRSLPRTPPPNARKKDFQTVGAHRGQRHTNSFKPDNRERTRKMVGPKGSTVQEVAGERQCKSAEMTARTGSGGGACRHGREKL